MKKYLVVCFLQLIIFNLLAQVRTISGVVYAAEDGSTVPGVNVLLIGTTEGTVTDIDGKYSFLFRRLVVPCGYFIGLRRLDR
jgi:hypothetical protein